MSERNESAKPPASSPSPLSLNSERALHVFSDILDRISRLTDLKTTLDEILLILRKVCECRHLAIRLIDPDGRIPIFAKTGLSEDFIEYSHWLTLDDCMCGHVAKGDVDCSLPNYTEHGSFYSNSLKEFMKKAAQNKGGVPKERLRSYCTDHGYQSVAIIPVKFKGEIIAELYLSDERPGIFPAGTVAFMEKVSHQIGISIKNSQLFTQLEESKRQMAELFHTAPTGIIELDKKGDLLLVNAFGAGLLGYDTPAAMMGAGLNINDLRLKTADWENLIRSVDSGETVEDQVLAMDVKGERRYLVFSLTAVSDKKGSVKGYRSTFRDITDGVKLEEERQEKALTESLKNRYYRETQVLKDELKSQYPFEEMIGAGPPMQAVKRAIMQVAATDTTVLIRGETGTGKELVARYIHELSLRKDRILVKVNCAALSEGLITSELFGHEKGAFTGAIQKRTGRFEYADNATIFLDEIGDLPLETQAMLLRVLQDGEFERVGSSKTLKVNVRLIAATNRALAELVKAKTFREDLYFRLNVFPIEVPPLRERKEDLPLLIAYFLETFGKKLGKGVTEVGERTMGYMMDYDWPGNIRELQNVIEHGLVISKGRKLEVPEEYFVRSGRSLQRGELRTLEDFERDYIMEVLERTSWVIYGENGAAKILGMKPTTLQSRMKKLGLEKTKD